MSVTVTKFWLQYQHEVMTFDTFGITLIWTIISDSFGFICPGFEISVSETAASAPIQKRSMETSLSTAVTTFFQSRNSPYYNGSLDYPEKHEHCVYKEILLFFKCHFSMLWAAQTTFHSAPSYWGRCRNFRDRRLKTWQIKPKLSAQIVSIVYTVSR